jgi:hypothetical protein
MEGEESGINNKKDDDIKELNDMKPSKDLPPPPRRSRCRYEKTPAAGRRRPAVGTYWKRQP